MKKILFTIAIIMTMAFGVSAQDFFIKSGESYGDQPAPLGSGLLVLTALGAGYAVLRKKS